MSTTAKPGQPLTERELQLLKLASEGLSLRNAGKAMEPPMSDVTAWRTLANVYVKIGAENLPNAVLLACRAGLLDGKPRRHGDHAGFAAHLYRGEDPCDACWDGERAYRRGRKASRRAAQQPPAATGSARPAPTTSAGLAP